jgi:hypothetical protein
MRMLLIPQTVQSAEIQTETVTDSENLCRCNRQWVADAVGLEINGILCPEQVILIGLIVGYQCDDGLCHGAPAPDEESAL